MSQLVPSSELPVIDIGLILNIPRPRPARQDTDVSSAKDDCSTTVTRTISTDTDCSNPAPNQNCGMNKGDTSAQQLNGEDDELAMLLRNMSEELALPSRDDATTTTRNSGLNGSENGPSIDHVLHESTVKSLNESRKRPLYLSLPEAKRTKPNVSSNPSHLNNASAEVSRVEGNGRGTSNTRLGTPISVAARDDRSTYDMQAVANKPEIRPDHHCEKFLYLTCGTFKNPGNQAFESLALSFALPHLAKTTSAFDFPCSLVADQAVRRWKEIGGQFLKWNGSIWCFATNHFEIVEFVRSMIANSLTKWKRMLSTGTGPDDRVARLTQERNVLSRPSNTVGTPATAKRSNRYSVAPACVMKILPTDCCLGQGANESRHDGNSALERRARAIAATFLNENTITETRAETIARMAVREWYSQGGRILVPHCNALGLWMLASNHEEAVHAVHRAIVTSWWKRWKENLETTPSKARGVGSAPSNKETVELLDTDFCFGPKGEKHSGNLKLKSIARGEALPFLRQHAYGQIHIASKVVDIWNRKGGRFFQYSQARDCWVPLKSHSLVVAKIHLIINNTWISEWKMQQWIERERCKH